jgi:acylphosphatase
MINAVSTPALIRRCVTVSGRVQGVFFRESCKRLADEYRVSGSAKNLADGRVEVILEGGPAGVQHVLDWCRSGPPSARVDEVEIVEEEPRGENGFIKG